MRENKIYSTLEHGFKSDKAEDAEDEICVQAIKAAPTPKEAKQSGGQLLNTLGWNIKKKGIMRTWLWYKFTQNPDLADNLCSTEGYHLIKASP